MHWALRFPQAKFRFEASCVVSYCVSVVRISLVVLVESGFMEQMKAGFTTATLCPGMKILGKLLAIRPVASMQAKATFTPSDLAMQKARESLMACF